MKLFNFQREGVNWMKSREDDYENVRGGILADEMGMGKTRQMATLIKENSVKRTLLIIPAVTSKDWSETLKSLKINHAIYPKLIDEDSEESWVQIYTNGYLCRMSPGSRTGIYDWDRVVIDEGHFLLNKYSCQSKNLENISSEFWWVLTATPVKLGNEFQNYFNLFGDEDPSSKEREDLDEIMLARKVKEIPELYSKFPKKRVKVKMINPLTDEDVKYNKLVKRANDLNLPFLHKSIRFMQGSLDSDAARQALYRIFNDEEDNIEVTSSQYAKYSAILKDLNKDLQRPTIIFCRFKKEIATLKALIETKVSVGVIDGESKDYLDSPNSEPPTVLLCQSSVASVGINLQYYNRVFLTMPMWSSWIQDQAIARSYRYGQKNKVKATIYCLKGSIDEYFLQRHELMREVW